MTLEVVKKDGALLISSQSCNPYLLPNSVVTLWIQRASPEGMGVCQFSVTLPASGDLIVDGDLQHHTVAVKWPDGRVYQETKIVYAAKWNLNLNKTRTDLENKQHQSQIKAQHQLESNTRPQLHNKSQHQLESKIQHNLRNTTLPQLHNKTETY
ncbi:hypothetical protein BJV82DRAFT_671429 [Fennellomyces sp. T-0311]|nr:hypothetical protein BJV82DRAFT_671429 [Fennellomyces sp. T-0311]